MSLLIRSLSAGKLTGTVYTFEKAGDTLPMHHHGEADNHITIVARGSVRAHGPAIGDNQYSAGAVLDWDVGIEHEIVAVEDNSRIVNIIKG